MTDGRGFGENEARKIIERAVAIDAEHGSRVDAAALRAIAAEAGISAAAVDKALEEHTMPAPARLPWRKRHPVLLTVAVMAAVLVLYVIPRFLVSVGR